MPLNSLDLLFKPEYASKLKDCGIAIIDSPQEVIGLALHYLGKDPYSTDKTDLDAAQALLHQLQPSVLYVASGRQINDLANGSVCLALAYNGDASMAADQARKANKPYEVAYRIPKEGTLVMARQPGDPQGRATPGSRAPIHRIHAAPRVRRRAHQHAVLRHRQPGRDTAGRRGGAQRPGHISTADIRQRLYADRSMSLKDMRQRTRVWTTFRSCQ